MLNHSCVRCRSKKLRCDGESPCGNCLNKGLNDECRHITRKARPRKDQTASSNGDTSSVASHPSPQQKQFSYPARYQDHGSPKSPQDETLLRLAREALGNVSVCTDLIDAIFYWKVQSIVHATIDLQKVIDNLRVIFDEGSPPIEADEIVLCMMTVALCLQYLPKQDVPLNLIARLESIDRTLGPRLRQRLLWQLSLNFVRHRMNQTNHSFTHIQTLVELLVYDQQSSDLREQIFDHAVQASKQLGMHYIEADDGTITTELKVRAWWFLVTRSWFSSLSNPAYSIHPHEFSTRLPVERPDLDMLRNRSNVSKSPFVYLPVRFSFTLISLSEFIRRLVDYRQSGNPDIGEVIEEEFETFAEQLPARYNLASKEEERTSNLEATSLVRRSKLERWLIHQQLFHAYLELHHFESTTPVPEACLFMANYMIDIQGLVSNTCYVLDSLRFNVTNVVKAASVLLLDLMQAPKKSGIARSITINKIQNALRKSQASTSTYTPDFDQIRDMLDLEQTIWQQTRKGSQLDNLSEMLPKNEKMDIVEPPLQVAPMRAEPEVDWSSFLPSDTGLYPIFLSDANGAEWQRIYESFLDSSSAK